MFVVLSCLYVAALWSPAEEEVGVGGWPLGSLVCAVSLRFCHFPMMWCPGSGEVLDCFGFTDLRLLTLWIHLWGRGMSGLI